MSCHGHILKFLSLFNPNSVKSLRTRASKLPDSPYKFLLELTADQIENKVITIHEAKKIISYVRTGNPIFLEVALNLLQLNKEQLKTFIEKNSKLIQKEGTL